MRRAHRTTTLKSKPVPSSVSTEPGQGLLLVSKRSNGTQHADCYYQEPYVSPSLSLSPWKTDIFITYLAANITGPMETVCANLAVPSYRPDSLQRTATKECFLALATTFFGVSHAQESLVHDGRRLYGRALKMVSSAIKDSSGSVTDIISAVFALCLYEVSLRSTLPPLAIFTNSYLLQGNRTNA